LAVGIIQTINQSTPSMVAAQERPAHQEIFRLNPIVDRRKSISQHHRRNRFVKIQINAF
jgi:hypothetical protein